MICPKCGHYLQFAPTTGSADERDRRLMMAEELLSDLASGYWTAILDDNDDPVTEKMGQRVRNYWRTWDSPQNAGGEGRAIARTSPPPCSQSELKGDKP